MAVVYVKETNPKDIDPTNVQHQLPLNQTYAGIAASATIQEIQADARKDDLEKFRRDSRNFLIESILEIKQRFDLDAAEVLEVVQCISPAKAAARIPPTLAHIFQKLPYLANLLDVKNLDQKWREHSLEKKIKSDLSWDEYWSIIKNATIPTGEPKYPCLVTFVEIIASLPLSNAAVERIFSLLEQVKTDHRTSVKSASLVSLLQCKMALKNSKSSAARLKPGKKILDLASKMKANATDDEAKELRKKFLDISFSKDNDISFSKDNNP